MPDIRAMKDELSRLYNGQAWQDRLAKMSDNQIRAIYMRKIVNKGR